MEKSIIKFQILLIKEMVYHTFKVILFLILLGWDSYSELFNILKYLGLGGLGK
jgi:hypothetical protein